MFAYIADLGFSEKLFAAGILIVIIELAALIVFLSKLSRAFESNLPSDSADESAPEAPAAPAAAPVSASASALAPAPVAAPAGIRLIDVDERTAAVVMALTSHESGIPLERLSFKSIRCLAPAGLELEGVDENTVAAIMAIVSNESGIPLERLSFKSIKKVEE